MTIKIVVIKRMDIVTQRNLVAQAANNDPRDALSLCQIDNRYRYVCGQLANETKFKVCLDSENNAKECDKVPMYSRDQFLRLIPSQIEIFPDEPLQLRHEFYSQNYKLKDSQKHCARLKSSTLSWR